MIETKDLTKHFEDLTAVNQINLQVDQGEVLALLGPNGAGKTTTIRMLTSLLKPSSGEAFVGGHNVVTEPDLVRRSVGVLTEQHGLYNRMKGREYLEFFGSVYGLDGQELKDKTAALLDQFGLSKAAEKKVGEYSKGMRQKIALARALIHTPPILLLDEPTSAMDPESARLVRNSIKELKSSKRSIIICTHNLFEAEELADKVAIIHLGRIILQGKIEQLKRDYHQGVMYRVYFASDNNFRKESIVFPETISNIEFFEGGINYLSSEPYQDNPWLVDTLVGQGVRVFSLEEIPTSLEKLYLSTVGMENGRTYME